MSDKKILLVAINAKYIHANLAVYCLKGYSEEYKDNIEIAEYTINQYTDYIIQNIYKRKPDVVAFSCYIWNINYVTDIIRDLKKVMKDLKIWVGGPEVSYRAKDFLSEYREVAGVMVGEGEKTFNSLCKLWIDNAGSLENIKGIVYRKDTPGAEIIDNGMSEIMDLTEVPFPYYDMTDFKNKIIYYETSRGCPFSCSYCLSSIDKKLRFRDMDVVKKELKSFIDNKVLQVKFVDRTFNCKKSHALEIWNYIYENDNGITNFHFEIAADLIDEEMLLLFEKMRPGLIQLEIGVQTTNPVTLKAINRYMDIEKIKKVVEKINSFKNIHQHLDLIVGLPYEDYESFVKSFNDVYYMRPEQLQLGFLKVLSGAIMEEKVSEYQIEYTTMPPYEVLSTKWISYDDIIKLKKIENVVEIYYNSRQFVNSLEYIENKFESPFEMFEVIGNYYELHKLDEAKHSRIQSYNILLECINDYFKEDEIFIELLKLDIYLRENIKSRPQFLKDENKELLRPFYREYKAKGKLIHIEEFEIDVSAWINEKKINTTSQIILFDYSNINPVNHCCDINVLFSY